MVLTGYDRQTLRNFEMVIADDGSGPEVGQLIGKFSKTAAYPVRYVSHPDEGYRKTKILNQAVLAASTPYLIFADADCIPHRNFVAAHCDLMQPGTVLCGRRVNLNGATSSKLSPEDVLAGKLERFTLIRLLQGLVLRGGHWEEAYWVKNKTLHRWINWKEPTLLGCNFSLEKKLLGSCDNGLNEIYTLAST